MIFIGTIFSENLFFKNLLKKHTNNSCLYFIALKTDETLSIIVIFFQKVLHSEFDFLAHLFNLFQVLNFLKLS